MTMTTKSPKDWVIEQKAAVEELTGMINNLHELFEEELNEEQREKYHIITDAMDTRMEMIARMTNIASRNLSPEEVEEIFKQE